MNEDLKKAITALANKTAEATKPDDAMKFSQAALNLAHTVASIENLPME